MSAGGGAPTSTYSRCVVQDDSYASGQSCVCAVRASAPQMHTRLTVSYHPTDSPRVSPSTSLICLVWSSLGVVSGGRHRWLIGRTARQKVSETAPEEGLNLLPRMTRGRFQRDVPSQQLFLQVANAIEEEMLSCVCDLSTAWRCQRPCCQTGSFTVTFHRKPV